MSLSFQQKLWIPLICSLGCMVAIFLYGTMHARQITIDERKLMLQHVDDVAFSIVKQFGEQANTGALNQADAQKRALAVIKGLRYGKDGYIAISDSQGRAVMHPFKPEADGKDMSGFKDAKGNFMYQDIARVGKSAEGAGYVQYYWTRPGGKEPVEKLGRVMHYAPWQWDIVTGVYVDDIDDSFRATLIETGLVLLAVCAQNRQRRPERRYPPGQRRRAQHFVRHGRHAHATGANHQSYPPQRRRHRRRFGGNRQRQYGPVGPHRGAGQRAGRDGGIDGAVEQRRGAECGQRHAGQPDGAVGRADRRSGRPGGR
jgi:hypothetical protein